MALSRDGGVKKTKQLMTQKVNILNQKTKWTKHKNAKKKPIDETKAVDKTEETHTHKRNRTSAPPQQQHNQARNTTQQVGLRCC